MPLLIKIHLISPYSRKIGAKNPACGAGITYRTSFGTFLSGRLPCGHRACPSRISYRGIVKLFCKTRALILIQRIAQFYFFVKLPHLRGNFLSAILPVTSINNISANKHIEKLIELFTVLKAYHL